MRDMNKAYKIVAVFVGVMLLISALAIFFNSQLWLKIKDLCSILGDMSFDEAIDYLLDKGLLLPIISIWGALLLILWALISVRIQKRYPGEY